MKLSKKVSYVRKDAPFGAVTFSPPIEYIESIKEILDSSIVRSNYDDILDTKKYEVSELVFYYTDLIYGNQLIQIVGKITTSSSRHKFDFNKTHYIFFQHSSQQYDENCVFDISLFFNKLKSKNRNKTIQEILKLN